MAKFTPSNTATPDLNVDDGTLLVDENNNRVGVATESPSHPLTVTGDISGSGKIFNVGGIETQGSLGVTGSISVRNDIIFHDGGSLKEGGGTAALTFDGSGNVTKIGVSTQTSGQFLKFDGSKYLTAAVSGEVAGGVAADDINAGDGAVNIKTTSGAINLGHADNDEAINIGSTGTGAIQIGHSTTTSVGVATTALTVASDTTTFTSANADDPLVQLKNTTNDASGARLQFVKDKGAAGADGDDIGVIEFVGDDAAQTQTTFAKIVAEVSEADNTDEAGKLSFFVAESDGTTTALAAGLVLEGEHATNGEVDVTIGAGAASTTTVVGTSQFNAAATFGVDDTGVDVRMFSATTNEGVLYDASEDELALLLTTKLKFHDVGGGEEIFASADGHLEINAGTTLDITAPTVDINAATALNIDGSLTVVATDAQTTNGIIGQFQAGDGSGAEVNRISINCSTSNQDTGISFMDNGATKWTLGNDGSTDDFHIRVGYGVYAVTDELVLTAAGKMTLLDDTASSATQGGAIRLVSNDGAVMGDNHRLGVIEFAGAEDTSNTISIGARIQAICRAAWDGSNNDADLEFYTTDGTTESLVLTLDADKLATFSGAALFSGNTTFGVDDTGVDVRIFSATASEGVLYDASEDELALLLTTKLKFHDVGGGEEIFASANGHLEVNAGTTLDMTAPTVDINASTAVTIDTDTLTVESANSTDPLVIIKNTTNDANGARLQFVKDKGAAGADGDDIGVIEFIGDDAAQAQTTFAKIVAEVSEADNTDEAGKLSFFVAESDGTDTALAAGLILEGEHATDGQVDVTIGAGAASTTTIVGTSQFNAAATFGVDDTGVDVRLFSATASEGVLYDASEDELGLLLTTKLKFHDIGGGEEIFASTDGHLEVNAGTTLDMTAPTIDLNAATALTIDGPAVTVADSAAGKPVLTLKTTHTTKTSSGELQFLKDAADTEDGEVLGQITFYGEDEGNNNTQFAGIVASISESAETDEAGTLELQVAESDGTNTAITTGLKLEGEHATNGQVDVTIGAGVGSTTTIVGDAHLNHDAAQLKFGVDSDVSIAHLHNIGLQIACNSANAPQLVLKGTSNDANGPILTFTKDKGAAGADSDDIGTIQFIGDDAAQTQTTFAKIVAEVSEADDSDEAGKLSFFVAESDGTTTTLTAGLVLEGEHATDGEIDVTIGAGAASTTTVAGQLDVTSGIEITASEADTIELASGAQTAGAVTQSARKGVITLDLATNSGRIDNNSTYIVTLSNAACDVDSVIAVTTTAVSAVQVHTLTDGGCKFALPNFTGGNLTANVTINYVIL